MANINFIGVVVEVAAKGTALGTDDRVYLGVYGLHGGRELCLDSAKDDFEPGSQVSFRIGDNVLFGPGIPRIPKNAGADAFAHNKIGLAGVTHVYLRKHGLTTASQDDALRLNSVEVLLTDGEHPSRTFSLRGAVTLSIGCGLTVWLQDGQA